MTRFAAAEARGAYGKRFTPNPPAVLMLAGHQDEPIEYWTVIRDGGKIDYRAKVAIQQAFMACCDEGAVPRVGDG